MDSFAFKSLLCKDFSRDRIFKQGTRYLYQMVAQKEVRT